jgi:hypothetical protein
MICRTILNETSYFGKGAIKEIANESWLEKSYVSYR